MLSEREYGIFEFGESCSPGKSVGPVEAIDETLGDAVEIVFDLSDAGIEALGACHPWLQSGVSEKVRE
jgi:hypothetical protein